MKRDRGTGFEVPVTDDAETVLFAERLRDGRLALGTRTWKNGEWQPSELHILERPAYLALAGWLTEPVEEAWLGSARDRRDEVLRTAVDLYGDASDGAERLAQEMLRQIPPALLRRALLLLVNSIGPEAHDRMVDRLNRTRDVSEDAHLRRRIAESHESLAYAVAAAALLDAVEEGVAGPGMETEDGAE